MSAEDWRVEVEVEGPGEVGALMERLRHGLGLEARELARALTEEHLVVSRDGNHLFVYAGSPAQAGEARNVIEAELREHGLTATVSRVQHWLADDERWDSEPPGPTWEEEAVARGYAPWEVRVTCSTHAAAVDLAERLEGEGYRPVRRWRYLIVGADTREAADELALRLDGEVETGGAVVWSDAVESGLVRPFALF